jgi:hypothetical protein
MRGLAIFFRPEGGHQTFPAGLGKPVKAKILPGQQTGRNREAPAAE